MDTNISRKLNLEFGAADADGVTVTLYDHKADLAADVVATTMSEVVALEVLTNADGTLMTDVLAAKEVITTENIIF